MNKRPECVELQSRMVEFFSGPPGQTVPAEISAHLEGCPECRTEFDQLCQTVEILQRSEVTLTAVPEHLLAAVESRLDATPQLRPMVSNSNEVRNLLIVQYSYLAFMSVVIWVTLLFAQPFMTGWLVANGMESAIPLFNEYGLFLAFFAAGGIFALISSPLIIRTIAQTSNREKKTGFFYRLFSGSLRMFAC
ncbi:MAG TPA: hypothetical protein PLK58_17140 [Candidatus Rifleibacterium sp.]|nr:hypothetical protein [Candidatus Rifleibacterium sp.]